MIVLPLEYAQQETARTAYEIPPTSDNFAQSYREYFGQRAFRPDPGCARVPVLEAVAHVEGQVRNEYCINILADPSVPGTRLPALQARRRDSPSDPSLNSICGKR